MYWEVHMPYYACRDWRIAFKCQDILSTFKQNFTFISLLSVYTDRYMLRSEDNLGKLVLSFHHRESKEWTLVIRLVASTFTCWAISKAQIIIINIPENINHSSKRPGMCICTHWKRHHYMLSVKLTYKHHKYKWYLEVHVLVYTWVPNS